MPIQTLMKNGKRYYRYGDSGKLYPTKKQAEEQMRAMYASGYREKTNEKSKHK